MVREARVSSVLVEPGFVKFEPDATILKQRAKDIGRAIAFGILKTLE